MATTIDSQLSKTIRTFERDRQRHRKPRDRRKNKQSNKCRCCHPSKYDGNGGTLRAGREKLCIQRVSGMQREAMNLLYRDEDNAEEDWVAETSGPIGSRVDLATILFTIAKPERQRRRGVAKDFVVIPAVKRVQCIDDEVFEDLFYSDGEEDEWEVLVPHTRSYAAAAHP